MIVMDYADGGCLRQKLPDILKDQWKNKLKLLNNIIDGLRTIHELNFAHCDFHDGNILFHSNLIRISEFGLCQPVESFQSPDKNNKKIFGVLPFMAPEVLRGKPYTQASDVYSFSMIMWEFTSGIPPFDDKDHDFQLSLNICRGERPEIIENTPQCYIDLMKKCWDKDPLKRPNASEVKKIINNWILNITESIDEESDDESENINEESDEESENINEKSDMVSENINEESDEKLKNINEESDKELGNINEESDIESENINEESDIES